MTERKDQDQDQAKTQTQSGARAQAREGMSPGQREMDDQGKTSRSTDEIRQQVEADRNHGQPSQTQQIPVTPAPFSQEELERREEEKREQNREAQVQDDGQTAHREPDDGREQQVVTGGRVSGSTPGDTDSDREGGSSGRRRAEQSV